MIDKTAVLWGKIGHFGVNFKPKVRLKDFWRMKDMEYGNVYISRFLLKSQIF